MDDLQNLSADYSYLDAKKTHSNQYLWQPIEKIVRAELPDGGKIFEIGCGNGATAGMLLNKGYEVIGVDPSESGINIAMEAHPLGTFCVKSAYDDLAGTFGKFPLVISLEVIEHCFWPRKLVKTAYELVEPGGLAVFSTPYHGYLKNLVLAFTNKMDFHYTALWDGGHIKFFSRNTLQKLLEEYGFEVIGFMRVGRIGPLAKSMIALARRPAVSQTTVTYD